MSVKALFLLLSGKQLLPDLTWNFKLLSDRSIKNKMELKPRCVCGIICNGLGRKTYFYDMELAAPNLIGGNYER